LPVIANTQSYFTYFLSRIKDSYKRSQYEFTPISENEKMINDLAAMEYAFAILDEDGNRIKWLMVVLARGKTGWEIACRCNLTCWTKYQSDFEKIINSFMFLN
jgi:hypothetical protein